MPTEILVPGAQGFYHTYHVTAGTLGKVAAMADNSDATRIGPNPNDPTGRESYLLAAHSTPDGADLTAVTLAARTYADNYNLYFGLRLGGVDLDGPAIERGIPQTFTRLWRDEAQDMLRPGAGTFTGADLATLEIMINLNYGGSFDPQVARMFLVVDSVLVASGSSFITLLSLIAGTLGSALTLQDVGRAAGWLARTRGIRLSADEVRQAWRELRAYRWPRTFDLGGAA